MLIDSEKIKQTKEFIEIMQAFIDGKEIEFKPDSYKETWKQTTSPTWDFTKYKYRIKQSEPEFKYPIYKRSKTTPEAVVKFTSLDSGVYISTHKHSIYKPGDAALNMAPHTDSLWEDCTVSELEDRAPFFHKSSAEELVDLGMELPDYIAEQLDDFELERLARKEKTEELFEVMSYCDIMKEFEFVKQLYKEEDLENKKHLQKTGRSFIINKATKQLIKVNYN